MNPNGQTLISGSSDNHVIIWELTTGEVVSHFTAHTDDVTGVAFSADGRMALSGSMDGTLRLWRTLPPKELITWAQENRLVRSLTCAEQALYRIQGPCVEVAATPEATSAGS
jgi:WD40 repeat protein